MQSVYSAACFPYSLFILQPVYPAACLPCSLFTLQPVYPTACLTCACRPTMWRTTAVTVKCRPACLCRQSCPCTPPVLLPPARVAARRGECPSRLWQRTRWQSHVTAWPVLTASTPWCRGLCPWAVRPSVRPSTLLTKSRFVL